MFLASLPEGVFRALENAGVEINILPLDISAEHGFVLYETGNICEGVLRVLRGEDSPSNLLAFIEKDERIEEDNRPKIATLAYEIQTKLFDPVLPILKQAGFPIKEGRVAQPPKKAEVLSPKLEEGIQSPYAPVPSPLQGNIESRIPNTEKYQTKNTEIEKPALDEKNVRALVRIASGTSYSEAQLREAFEDLPQGLRQSISSVDTANAIQEIAKKYLLHVDQMGALASETGLVLLGLTHPAEFIPNLAKRLRLPEERAKEIARDVSAQILVKVREALRTFHSERPESSNFQSPISKQTSNPNIQSQPSQRISLPAKVGGTPFVKGDTTTLPSSPKPEVKSYQLEASSTPYSAGAKWNTGENILAKQAVQKEEALSRAEMLRGIENPSELQVPSSKFTGQPKTSNLQPKTLVGPTGWKPGGKSEVGSMKYEVRKEVETQKAPSNLPPPPAPLPRPIMPTSLPQAPFVTAPKPPAPLAPLQKARPQSESGTPPVPTAPKKETETGFLDQKLQTPMASPREEKRYTSDPYREPLA